MKQTAVEVFEPIPAPPKQHSRSDLSPRCIFLTSREKVMSRYLFDGVILQFELPDDVFPSFHGVTCSCSYSIAVTAEYDGGSKHSAFFPIRVSGPGSGKEIQFIRYFAFLNARTAAYFLTQILSPRDLPVNQSTGYGLI